MPNLEFISPLDTSLFILERVSVFHTSTPTLNQPKPLNNAIPEDPFSHCLSNIKFVITIISRNPNHLIMTMKKPYEYLDYRDMLNDWYQERKAQGHFSFQSWADQAGFSAKDFLYRVMQGDRNLSNEGALKVAHSMDLGKSECEYFLTLVRFNQAENTQDREVCWNKLKEILKLRQYTSEHARLNFQHYSLMTKCHHQAILSILRSSATTPSSQSIAEQLHPPLSEAQTRKSMELLGEFNYLDPSNERLLTPHHSDYSSDNNLNKQILREYYSDCYTLALNALENFKADELRYQSQTLRFNPENLETAHHKIQNLISELQALSNNSPTERTYMLNINVFPMTK